jgi:hypothetical protein
MNKHHEPLKFIPQQPQVQSALVHQLDALSIVLKKVGMPRTGVAVSQQVAGIPELYGCEHLLSETDEDHVYPRHPLSMVLDPRIFSGTSVTMSEDAIPAAERFDVAHWLAVRLGLYDAADLLAQSYLHKDRKRISDLFTEIEPDAGLASRHP